MTDLVNPSGWPRPRGYSNAAAGAGKVIAISGQVGWDPRTEQIASDDFAEQCERALANIVEALRAAGAAPPDVIRLTWYVTDRAAYVAARSALGDAYRRHFGSHYPAMSVVFVSSLLDPRAQVEIEATAVSQP